MSNLITPTFSEEDEKKVMELLAKLKAKFLSCIKLSPLWQGLSITSVRKIDTLLS